jgi:hypothetical protein
VIGPDHEYNTAANAFAVYKENAIQELDRISSEGVQEIPGYLYSFRNRLAHGKQDVLAGGFGEPFQRVAPAIPIVKLPARMAIEAA